MLSGKLSVPGDERAVGLVRTPVQLFFVVECTDNASRIQLTLG